MPGIVRKVHFEEGAVVQVGETLVTIETSDDDEDDEDGAEPAAPAAPAAAASDEWTEADEDDSPHKILTSPAVRALAREHQLDLRRVVATGPKGRVTKGDVMAYLDSLQASGPTTVAAEVTEGLRTTEADSIPAQSRPQTAPAPVSPQAPPPAAARTHESTTVPLRGYRKAMVKSMSVAATIPHFHFCEEVQVGRD